MTKPRNRKSTVEDQLAEYTDRILNDQSIKQHEATFAPDPEMRDLEETALHLKTVFGNSDPDEVTIQRMHNNIIGEWQQAKNKHGEPFWQRWLEAFKPSGQKWQSQRERQRISIALSLAVLIVLMLIGIPLMSTPGPGQPGASGQNLNGIYLVVFGGLILLVLWLFRRKP